MKTTKIDTGYYAITVNGITFEAETMERATEGRENDGWRLLIREPEPDLEDDCYHLEWCNDFWTLKECKDAAEQIASW